MPKRIQRKRTKGWKMPEGAVYVGRPTKWGNPYILNECRVIGPSGSAKYATKEMAAEMSLYFYRQDLEAGYYGVDLNELRGKDLVCWCPLDQPCHADILLELANKEVLNEWNEITKGKR